MPKGVAAGDVENSIDVFNYYADAPLTYLVCDSSFEKDSKIIPQEILSKVVGEAPTFVPSLTTRKADPAFLELLD